MKYNGAEIIIKLLGIHGVDTVVGIPGGANLPLYHALGASSLRHILARHEQGAGFIAQGIARSTGKPAVCLATSGPGATNLLTAIADAYCDSVPIIAITGQVPLRMLGTDAFQEVDTCGLTMPITKHNFLVRRAEDLLEIVPRSFEIARCGRPGPVLIDVPRDVQEQIIEIDSWPETITGTGPVPIDDDNIRRIAEMINGSSRPLLYSGGGTIASGSSGLVTELSRKNGIPVCSTLMGLGGVPVNDPLYLGMLGMHGDKSTNIIVNEADLILAFGVRFGDRSTGMIDEFCPGASIVHINIEGSEINKIKKSHYSVIADLKDALCRLVPLVAEDSRDVWLKQRRAVMSRYPSRAHDPSDPRDPVSMIGYAGKIAEPDAIITTDVGQHQMWVARTYPFSRSRTFLTSGGLGTMGFGLPAAIGAALANPERQVLCFSGDGSFLMNIQELSTLADHGLNVKILIMNNRHLGLVRQQQELFFDKNYYATRFISRPDFAAIARDFGLDSCDLGEEPDPFKALRERLKKRGPCVINIPIHEHMNVMPMVPPGSPNYTMIESSGDKRF